MKIAVIPARGGSKRIPRKNIKPFCGKPMIAWSIEAAHNSECFDEVVVSTDDNEIASVAEKYGANTPFVRPKELSDDYVGTADVTKHAIEWYIDKGRDIEYVCCLYATAPFVQANDISAALATLRREKADFVLSVTTFPFPIQRAIKLNEHKRLSMFSPEYQSSRSQDLEEAWHDAGQFYWGQTEAWLNEQPLFSESSVGFPLPRHQVQDIDTPEDWTRAEWLFKAMQAKK